MKIDIHFANVPWFPIGAKTIVPTRMPKSLQNDLLVRPRQVHGPVGAVGRCAVGHASGADIDQVGVHDVGAMAGAG